MTVNIDTTLLSDLRATGVKSASFSEDLHLLSVEFFPSIPTSDGPIVPREMTQNAPLKEDDCACGHMAGPAHDQQGLCLLGCDAAKCASGPK